MSTYCRILLPGMAFLATAFLFGERPAPRPRLVIPLQAAEDLADLSADGRLLATLEMIDGPEAEVRLRLRETGAGAVVSAAALPYTTQPLRAALLADGAVVAVGPVREAGALHLCDPSTGQVRSLPNVHAWNPSPDGRRLAVLSQTSPEEAAPRFTLTVLSPAARTEVTFPEMPHAERQGAGAAAWLLNLPAGAETVGHVVGAHYVLSSFADPAHPVLGRGGVEVQWDEAAVAPDGRTVARWRGNNAFSVISLDDAGPGQHLAELPLAAGEEHPDLRFAADGTTLTACVRRHPPPGGPAAGRPLRRAVTWDVRTGRVLSDLRSHEVAGTAERCWILEDAENRLGGRYLFREVGARLQLVDLATGRAALEVPDWSPLFDRLEECRLSPGGRLLALGRDGPGAPRIECWDLGTGGQVATLPGTGGPFLWSGGGTTLAAQTAGEEGARMLLWDVGAEPNWAPAWGAGGVAALAVWLGRWLRGRRPAWRLTYPWQNVRRPSRRKVAVAGSTLGAVGLGLWWGLPLAPRATLPGTLRWVDGDNVLGGPGWGRDDQHVAAVSGDGRWVATMAATGIKQETADLRLWDTATDREHPRYGQAITDLPSSDQDDAARFTADDRALLVWRGFSQPGTEAPLHWIHLASGRRRIIPLVGKVCPLADPRFLAVLALVARDPDDRNPPRELQILDLHTGREAARVNWSPTAPPPWEGWSPDFQSLQRFGPGLRLGFSTWDGDQQVFLGWDIPRRRTLTRVVSPGRWSNARVAARGQRLALVVESKAAPAVQVYDLPQGRLRTTVPLPQFAGQEVRDLALTPDGTAFTVETDYHVLTWDLTTGRRRWEVDLRRHGFCDLLRAENDDSGTGPRWLVRGWVGPPQDLVEVATGRVVMTLPANPGGRISGPNYRLSPDGRFLLFSQDWLDFQPGPLDAIGLWLLDHGISAGRWLGGIGKSPPRVQGLDLTTERALPPIPGEMWSLRFAANGRFLATRGPGGPVTVWELPPRRPWGWIVLGALMAVASVESLGWWVGRRRRKGAA